MGQKVDLDIYLEVLILRTLGVSLTSAAKYLGRATQLALDAENWIKESPQTEVETVVGDDARIRRMVGRDFPGMGLIDSLLIKAAQITGDDILLHYGRRRSIDRGPDPLGGALLSRHFARLCRQAEAMRKQLQLPIPTAFFSPDICSTVVLSGMSGSSAWLGPQWRSWFDTPLEWRRSTGGEGMAVEARLPLEAEDTFGNLRDHLSTESLNIGGEFEIWKTIMGQWLQTCLDQVHLAVTACRERTGLDYIAGGIAEGLFPAAPAYICQFAWLHPDANATPPLNRIARGDHWCLVPPDLPGWGLVLGPQDTIDQASLVLTDLISETARQPAWTQIREMHIDLKHRTAQLRSQLAAIIERGEFTGTCPSCPGRSSGVFPNTPD